MRNFEARHSDMICRVASIVFLLFHGTHYSAPSLYAPLIAKINHTHVWCTLTSPLPKYASSAFLLCILTDTPLTVRHIFEDNPNWGAFRLAEKDNLRDIGIKEVNKMLSCKDESRGFFAYRCKHCGTTEIVYFGCKLPDWDHPMLSQSHN